MYPCVVARRSRCIVLCHVLGLVLLQLPNITLNILTPVIPCMPSQFFGRLIRVEPCTHGGVYCPSCSAIFICVLRNQVVLLCMLGFRISNYLFCAAEIIALI